MANEMIEVERISDLAEGQYSDDSWLVIDTGTVVVKLKLKDAVPDASTTVKGKVQLSDSTGNDSSHVAATSKAVKSVMDALTQASEALSGAISGKYSKPSSGIPKSDLSSAVQTSLENGDTAVAALDEIGKPLVWKGTANVSTLNGTIEGLTNGWTYTLTDSGTLTAGSVSVQSGDEVAWTGSAWFKLGGEGYIKIFKVEWSERHSKYIYPTYAEIVNAAGAGVLPVLYKHFFRTEHIEYYVFRKHDYDESAEKKCSFDNNISRISIYADGTVVEKPMEYDTTLSSDSTNAVQNAALYAVIGNVESLLSAL